VMWISAVACRNMIPDPAFYADCLRASFDELIAAIDASAAGATRVAKGAPGAGARGLKPAATKAAPRKTRSKAAAAPPRATKGRRPGTAEA